ncbi:MAG: hypothetical protein JWL77_4253 [Chthonomonadaceae bacterium]|nr:hypothetical protein [Chthonomonadaceae bacterium]
MELTFRAACMDDFEAVYACCYSTFGFSDQFKAEVKVEWETFRQYANALSVIVEDLDRQAEDRVVGCTEAVFIANSFAEHAKTGQRPFLNKQIAELTRCGRSPLLDMVGIRKAQTGEGITLYVPYVGWREQVLSAEEAWKVREYMNRVLNYLGLGYYYREMMIEVAGEDSKNRGLAAGFYVRTDYAPFYRASQERPGRAGAAEPPAPGLQPYLLSITRAEAFRHDGSLVSHSFIYSKPRLGFTLVEQELLCWAMQGRGDDEIAPYVHVSKEAIKKRWDRIFAKVEEHLPSLLPSHGDGKRGPEKRGTLLVYLRDHPEELRPCIVALRGYGLPLQEKV